MRGLARVGIVALIDEATGYQEVRDRFALQAILVKFLRKELAVWAKRFPDEFYQEMFRLKNWQWKGMSVNRPQYVGKVTKDIVYARLAPGILKELKGLNPADEKGERRARHHQWLTEEVGHRDSLAADPVPPKCKKLKGIRDGERPIYRVRSGDYRILYVVRGGAVIILDIDHRKDVYR